MEAAEHHLLSLGWSKEKPLNDSKKLFISATIVDSGLHETVVVYKLWEVFPIYSNKKFLYWGLLDENQNEYHYEDLKADFYFQINLEHSL